jgi:antitoxin component of RelBE/YafQ-DinJ toxin-antitoxin module
MKASRKRKTGTARQLLPRFKSEEEEAEHWDTHSPLDLGAEPKAQKVQVRGAKDRPVTIRLDTETRRKLEELASRRGIGPSTLARLILVSAIERNGSSPGRSVRLDDLTYLLERDLTSAIRERSNNASKYTTASDTEKAAVLLLDKSKVNKLGELGLKAITILFESYGVQVIAQEHTKYKQLKNLAQSDT